jgi:N-acetylglucosaminyldiphosphoundecaprenol N-acetyl-beta-D-mannosaminyltransferase
MKPTVVRPSAQVLGIDVDAINMEGGVRSVATALQSSQKGYVCVAGVHGIMEAHRSPRLAGIYANSELTIPDGMPLVWVGRAQGHASMERVTGPDLMIEIFQRQEFANVTHYLYGGDEGVAEELRDKLTERFPWVKIVGTGMPPYGSLSAAEQKAFVKEISELKPDIIWVGISCPKQEQFMADYLPLLETKLMFGVGAAFDYHTGRIKDCAKWVKSAGLQWLHRLMQDPQRLWRRYLRNNSTFLWHIALQVSGLREYPVTPQAKMSEERRHAGVTSL